MGYFFMGNDISPSAAENLLRRRFWRAVAFQIACSGKKQPFLLFRRQVQAGAIRCIYWCDEYD
ncbi:hypothetical protein DOX45_07325 [Cronobacter malonaticus]|nr:hypothetical protein [Cronobacter malonaticus]